MNIELQKALFELSQHDAIDQGDVEACAELCSSLLFESLPMQSIGIWVNNQDTVIERIFQSGEGTCNMVKHLAIDNIQTYFQLMKQSHVQNFAKASEIPDSELIAKYLMNCDMTRSLHFMKTDNNVVVLIVCEFSDEHFTASLELTTFVTNVLKQFHRCVVAKKLQDISVLLNELKDQAIKSESMASLGSMVAPLTHEINNPLGVTITGVSHLKSEVDTLVASFNNGSLTEEVFQDFVDGCTEICSLLESNLSRAAKLVNDFKKTAVEQEAPSKVKFDICGCVASLVASLRPELKKHNIKINIQLQGPVYAEGYPGALSQIMTNLCFNSIKHAYENISEPTISIYGQPNSDTGLYTLIFEDNGNGIKKEIQDSVFTAFFTTKRGQGGSGLGMAIAKKQAREKLLGDIELDKDFESGARFLITLPFIN